MIVFHASRKHFLHGSKRLDSKRSDNRVCVWHRHFAKCMYNLGMSVVFWIKIRGFLNHHLPVGRCNRESLCFLRSVNRSFIFSSRLSELSASKYSWTMLRDRVSYIFYIAVFLIYTAVTHSSLGDWICLMLSGVPQFGTMFTSYEHGTWWSSFWTWLSLLLIKLGIVSGFICYKKQIKVTDFWSRRNEGFSACSYYRFP
jgi:hypothetical protein